MKQLNEIKTQYYKILDKESRALARRLSRNLLVTPLLLVRIQELYSSAKIERDFQNDNFETAYHSPISSDLEFFISRILYHYSRIKKLGWKIYLRRQVGKTCPDIRIDKKDKTIAVIEVKAIAGWIQPFFNSDRAKKDMLRMQKGTSTFDPRDLIKRVNSQLIKYVKTFHIDKKRIYVFLPTLALVHRSRSKRVLKDYISDFVKNSKLSKDNLILLSGNLNLHLSSDAKRSEHSPTNSFEKFIAAISK
ncbi:MAG: hypothetical protein KGJ93_04345 [Patescibacteria group bacterium]|nr:hypothetical protein [Patescibacteria group bacterium]